MEVRFLSMSWCLFIPPWPHKSAPQPFHICPGIVVRLQSSFLLLNFYIVWSSLNLDTPQKHSWKSWKGAGVVKNVYVRMQPLSWHSSWIYTNYYLACFGLTEGMFTSKMYAAMQIRGYFLLYVSPQSYCNYFLYMTHLLQFCYRYAGTLGLLCNHPTVC